MFKNNNKQSFLKGPSKMTYIKAYKPAPLIDMNINKPSNLQQTEITHNASDNRTLSAKINRSKNIDTTEEYKPNKSAFKINSFKQTFMALNDRDSQLDLLREYKEDINNIQEDEEYAELVRYLTRVMK